MRLEELTKIAIGIERPEDVAIARDGTVWASDKSSACARIAADGSFERFGRAGGEPNGITIDPADGSILIANLASGSVQRLRPETGSVETVLDRIGDERIVTPNYLLVDSRGTLWCSVSTRRARCPQWFDGTPDGFVFRVTAAGDAAIVADGLRFANGLALDETERFLYVAETSGYDVLRFPIDGDMLGSGERYGPAGLGGDAHPDGITFDEEGNLWVCLVQENRLAAIRPDGSLVTIMEDSAGALLHRPTNVTFGGPDMRDVYIGSIATNYVLRGRSSVPGARLPHQRWPHQQ
jgi:gluconolactonase